MQCLTVVGVGPGSEDLLTLRARRVIDEADVVFATKRHAALALGKSVHDLKPFKDACAMMETYLKNADVAVLVSGDPTQFSMTPLLKKQFSERSDIRFSVVPGVGSIQTLFSELCEASQDAVLRSLHGRPFDPAKICALARENPLLVFLTDATNNPARVGAALCAGGLGDLDVAIGEDLSYPEEVIWRGKAEGLSKLQTGGNCVLRIRNAAPMLPPISPTLQDEDFIRGGRPMTKREVRMLSVCKLGLSRDAIVWDAGAGTGSVGLQCALLAPMGRVYSIEREEEGIALIRKNAKALGVENLVAVPGDMPDALCNLPDPTHVFIGGSGGQMASILQEIRSRGSGIRVVLNAVTLKSAYTAFQILGDNGFRNLDCVQVQVSRSARAGLMKAENPVTILSAITCE